MMKRILTYAAILMAAVSCSSELNGPVSFGSLRLALDSDIEIDVATRSDETAGPYDDYNIHISGEHTGSDPYELDLVYGEAQWPLALPYGLYSVAAESCTEDEAHSLNDGYGAVRFHGVTEDVQIKSPVSEAVPVSVRCTMANAKVSVTFDEGFLSDFEDASVTLAISDRVLTLTSEQASSVQSYFNVDQQNGSLMTYTVHGSIDGTPLQYSSTVLLRPAKHARLTFKSNHNGVLGPQVSVDKEIGTNEIEGEIVPGSGSEVTGGDIEKPVIYVDYEIKDAVEVETVIDVIDKEDMTL